jgi:DNA-binding NtrC family response regulator
MPSTREEFLIVDNCLSIRTSMSLVLDEMGFRAGTAEDGFAALRQVRRDMPEDFHAAICRQWRPADRDTLPSLRLFDSVCNRPAIKPAQYAGFSV